MLSPPAIKVLFIEDDANDVKLMNRELQSAGINSIFKRVLSKKEFLFELEDFKPDVIVADYSLPMFNGMHAFRLFKEKKNPAPFILVTGSLDEQTALECLNEGVDDYILKSGFKRLPSIITRNLEIKRREIENKRIAAELESSKVQLMQLHQKTEKAKLHEHLSNREFEIFCMIASGKSVKEIAAQLFLSPATVATYRARVLEKMNLVSNVDITLYALRHKLID
jgi:DNA-binding NarL/FixJ family response regulator